MLAAMLVLLAPLAVTVAAVPGVRLSAGSQSADTMTARTSERQLEQNRERATAAYDALERSFYVSSVGLYREQVPWVTGNPYSYLWPLSHVLAATIHLAQMPGASPQYRADLQAQLATLDKYWNPGATPAAYDSYVRPPLGSGGDLFYDDNVWIGLELAAVYRLTGDQGALSRAREVFAYVDSGWDDDPTHPDPGGVYWVDASWDRQRSTVSTAFGALLGFTLFQLTQEPTFFQEGLKMYAWTNQYMLGPDGLYWDHVNLDGSVDTWENSYNQGAMIGASLALARITGDKSYVTWATHLADASLAHFGAFDGTGAQFTYTNAIFFDELQQLEQQTCSPAYLQAPQAYADRLWNLANGSKDGLLRTTPGAPSSLLDQSALVELYAQLSLNSPDCVPANPPAALGTALIARS